MTLTFPGPLLFLSSDPARIAAQLGGAVLDRAAAGPLRDDISTDEITPLPSLVYFDDRLGAHAHTGLKCADLFPIEVGAIQKAGISVVVGGRRYGKGSSREHSPVAEKAAGIRLVIAASFERIYRQNADNVGLLTSTDMALPIGFCTASRSRSRICLLAATRSPWRSCAQAACCATAGNGWRR